MLIKKDGSALESYHAQIKQQQDEASKKYNEAEAIYIANPDLDGLKASINQCAKIESQFQQRMCYEQVLKKNKDVNTCKALVSNTVAQYVCYVQMIRDKKMTASEVKSFCPDKMCIAAFAYRHYGMEGSLPEFLPHREDARKIETETSYHRQREAINYPSKGLEFHEVLHAEARTNRAIGLGYDLNFRYDGAELPSIGIGYYNLAENIFSADIVISGVQKPTAVRLALGAEFKNNYDTRYHLLYGFGLAIKSAGVAPLLEISSDFKKDHQVVFGLMFLFQPAR